MKSKAQYFFEWLKTNEHLIARTHQLDISKKLFWLKWIDWHVRFYLNDTMWFFRAIHSVTPAFHVITSNADQINCFGESQQWEYLTVQIESKDDNYPECLTDDPNNSRQFEPMYVRDLNRLEFIQAVTDHETWFCRLEMLPIVENLFSKSSELTVWTKSEHQLTDYYARLTVLYDSNHIPPKSSLN